MEPDINITLREITEDNFEACAKLEVSEEQKNFVANNTRSLAHAWLYYAYAHPFAIYNGDEPVGFLMLHIDKAKNAGFLWRFMIDKNHQGKGYGKAALRLAVEYFKSIIDTDEIQTSIVPGNEEVQKLYESFGFMLTGEVEDGEHVMALKLKKEDTANENRT